jgi:thiol-disulfide isomerase/thioredoxin
MSHPAPSRRLTSSSATLVILVGVLAGLATPDRVHAQAAGVAERPAGGGLTVPPLPAGTPEQLLKFVANLRNPPAQPKSREEMLAYMQGVAAVSVQAADKILAQVKPGEKFHAEASELKLESLMMLGQMGNEQAEADMVAYAKSLVDSPEAGLAREARRLLIVADAREAFSSGKLDAAAGLVKRTADLLVSDPDDTQTAMLAMQLAGAFEHAEGGEEHAAAAYATLGPIFARSKNRQIQQMGESFAGTLRRLSLPGKPMEITGTLLDGKPFDQKALAGKVVLVDFWATWCGPCVAEMPNILAQYEKYHAKGFEVVGISLDEDRAALETFVAEKKLPWPILFEKPEGAGWQHPMSTKYGISGIPQLILIGRDGNVITLNARGKGLAEKLDELFKDAG